MRVHGEVLGRREDGIICMALRRVEEGLAVAHVEEWACLCHWDWEQFPLLCRLILY